MNLPEDANADLTERTIVMPTAASEDCDRTIVTSEHTTAEFDRTMVLAATPDEPPTHVKPHHKKSKQEDPQTHFSLFNLDHTWFQSGKDVNESIDRNHQASLEEARLDSIHAFQEMALDPQLVNKDELFEHIKVFNEGGQGILSKVREKALDRVVALKSLRKELLDDPTARRNFLTEAKVSAQLEHPSIIPIYALSGDDEKGLHLAMKLISGMTLTSYLEETARHYKLDGIRHFNEAKALHYRLDLFLRICDAMSYAHGHNIMHRDLKPENIIIGEYREVYIMDWGIATHIITQAEDAEDGKKHVSGTPRFMAPEVIRGEAIDQRADVYALGLILFEMVYLKTGYTGKSTQEIFGKVLRGECESFEHSFGCKVSPELTAIVKKAMHPVLANRYNSVQELAQDLRRFLAGEETRALPDGAAEKILRFIGKHRRAVAISLAVLLLLVVGSAAFSFYQQRNEQIYRVRYNRAVGYTTTQMDAASYQIELQMVKLESILRLFSEEVDVRLTSESTETNDLVLPPMNAEGADQTGAAYSPIYKQLIDPAHLVYFIARDNANQAKAQEELKKLIPMAAKTRERFLNADLAKDSSKLSLPEQEKQLIEKGNPSLWIYFGSANGLYMQYPRGGNLPEDYDPRLRPWYETGVHGGGDSLVWSKPYLDAQTDWIVLTCTQTIRKDGKLLGVTAMDVSLDKFQDIMKKYGNNKKFTLGKYLIDRDGNILVTADLQRLVFLSANNSIGFNVKDMRDRKTGWHDTNGNPVSCFDLFVKMWWNDLGQIFIEKENRRVMFLYSRIRSLDWLYVEVIDLDKFIKENWNVLDDLEQIDAKLHPGQWSGKAAEQDETTEEETPEAESATAPDAQ